MNTVVPAPNLRLTDRAVREAPRIVDPVHSVMERLRRSELFRDYQRSFESITGLPLVLRDTGSFRTPLQGSPRVNSFCVQMTRLNQTCAACLQLQQRLEDDAARGPKTRQCYAGLSESVVPVRNGEKVLGYLQTGQVFLRAPSMKRFNATVQLMGRSAAGMYRRKLKAAYFQTRVFSSRQYAAVIRLLTIFAEHLAGVSNQMLLLEATAEASAITNARKFIAENQSEKLGLKDVARAVHMSPCYFCKFFHQETGLSFTEYLARGRIESVKQMLLNAQTRISEAAYAAGFQSLSQFNRIFRRVVGEAPSRYRGRLHGLVGRSPPYGTFVRAA
jgi:AraC-like DNA-binding protein/ligand-binding sensor protein